VIVHTADGGRHHFHMVYSVLGTVGRSELGRQLGCETGPDGRFVTVNNKRETEVLGVYAAGDVVDGLNQVRASACQCLCVRGGAVRWGGEGSCVPQKGGGCG
jgi:thioredoxin reductase